MLLNVADHRERARRLLPRFVFEYIDGAADDERCLDRNRADLDAITLWPRVLRDTTKIDTSVEVFGQRWTMPLGVAPTGLNGLIRPGGDRLLAAAAAAAGVPMQLSTAASDPLETVRAVVGDGPAPWMQLYVMDRQLAERIVLRAHDAEYGALVLTVDVPVSGMREKDVRNEFKLPFLRTPRRIWDVATHPAWALRIIRSGGPQLVNLTLDPTEANRMPLQAALLSRSMDRSLVWEHLTWLRRTWQGPLLLKGVLHPTDAKLALSHGVDGVIVSNHGGRQLDAAPSAIAALPGIVNAVESRIPVFMDSGIRRGTDIARALALGARAVFAGRPLLYGLASDGERGIAAVLALLRDELERAMTLLGARRPQELRDTLPSPSKADRSCG